MRTTRTRWLGVGVGVLVLLGAAPRSDALPDKPLPDTWNVTGTHSERGSYKAVLVLDQTRNEVGLRETLTFADGTQVTFKGTGHLDGVSLVWKGTSGVGLIGALDGTKKDDENVLQGTYVFAEDRKSMRGVWREGTRRGRERAEKAPSNDKGLLVLVDGDGKDVPRNKRESEGVVLAPDLRDRPTAPRQMLPFRLERGEDAEAGSKWSLDFPELKLAVWKDAAATQPVKSGEAFDGTGAKTTLYMVGLVPGAAGASETLRAQLVKDGRVVDTDRGKVTVAQAAFMVCGDGHSSTYRLESWASGRKMDARRNPTLVRSKKDKAPWAVFIFESRQGASLALSTPGAVVSYDGHSNFGLGFAFQRGLKKLRDFMLISDPQVAINWDYLREHQGHPDLMIEESEYGDDSSTPAFSDPIAVRRAIKGAHGSYDSMRTVRFPLSGGEGTRCTLVRGSERWHDNHRAIDGTRLVLKSGAPDMPRKGWSKLMLNSCYSGQYYYESFGGRGTMFFTLEESSSGATTAQFIAGCIDGESNDEILKTINGEENIWDYYVFGQ